MIRRDPTRIELKLDDIQEYERRKQEIEAEQIKNGFVQSSGRQPPEVEEPKKTRAQIIHERIGFDPTPRVN